MNKDAYFPLKLRAENVSCLNVTCGVFPARSQDAKTAVYVCRNKGQLTSPPRGNEEQCEHGSGGGGGGGGTLEAVSVKKVKRFIM